MLYVHQYNNDFQLYVHQYNNDFQNLESVKTKESFIMPIILEQRKELQTTYWISATYDVHIAAVTTPQDTEQPVVDNSIVREEQTSSFDPGYQVTESTVLSHSSTSVPHFNQRGNSIC